MGKETSFNLHIAEIMNQNVPLIERDMPLSHLINALLKTREKNAIIIDRNEKVTGLITPKIFFKNIANLGHFWKEAGTMLTSKYVELSFGIFSSNLGIIVIKKVLIDYVLKG